ncbi:unnamed protein product [Trichobilharzia regenti]|nr:unnamed protein product [Trichobilharzia regenti]
MASGNSVMVSNQMNSSSTPIVASESSGQNNASTSETPRHHGTLHGEAHPPPTQLIKLNSLAGPSLVRKEKLQTSSRFGAPKSRELNPLPLIKGMRNIVCIRWVNYILEFSVKDVTGNFRLEKCRLPAVTLSCVNDWRNLLR